MRALLTREATYALAACACVHHRLTRPSCNQPLRELSPGTFFGWDERALDFPRLRCVAVPTAHNRAARLTRTARARSCVYRVVATTTCDVTRLNKAALLELAEREPLLKQQLIYNLALPQREPEADTRPAPPAAVSVRVGAAAAGVPAPRPPPSPSRSRLLETFIDPDQAPESVPALPNLLLPPSIAPAPAAETLMDPLAVDGAAAPEPSRPMTPSRSRLMAVFVDPATEMALPSAPGTRPPSPPNARSSLSRRHATGQPPSG